MSSNSVRLPIFYLISKKQHYDVSTRLESSCAVVSRSVALWRAILRKIRGKILDQSTVVLDRDETSDMDSLSAFHTHVPADFHSESYPSLCWRTLRVSHFRLYLVSSAA